MGQVIDLHAPVTQLPSVGPDRANQLARLEISTLEQLLLHRPRRYEDRRRVRSIRDLALQEPAVTRGVIVACGLKRWQRGTRSVFEIILEDGTGRLHCRWWNLPFMERYFKVHDEILVFGKPISLKPRTIDHPETETLEAGEEPSIHLNRIAPIYPLTEGLPQRWLRALLFHAVQNFASLAAEPPISPVDRSTRVGLFPAKFPPRAEAIRLLHFPAEMDDIELARQRLAMDEYIELQKGIQVRRARLEKNSEPLPCGGTNELIKVFLRHLPFQLSESQKQVLREIRSDLKGVHPMRRLLQGDVGSGKTVVAGCAALMTLESGFNAAIMVPTEILAEQHFRTFGKWFDPLRIRISLLTGAGERLSRPLSNAPELFIGTHALLEKAFAPSAIGLVVIDEQHKFGVAQRETLLRKGKYPHLLVMTATPIPRTLGLTLYGDLDVSVIRERPAGRAQIKTFVRGEQKRAEVWNFLREKIKQGQQCYVVYARIDESEGEDVKAISREWKVLQKEFSPARVGLLHGRLSSEEKDFVMSSFRAHRLDLLLATSVIEVGIDVPNATVMVIENAERFGLAQLHQLRGRIGRGSEMSYCILLASPKAEEASARLRVMEETSDGFRIAEEDLRLRGPGELLGRTQSGAPLFRFADLRRDFDLIEAARGLVKESLIPK